MPMCVGECVSHVCVYVCVDRMTTRDLILHFHINDTIEKKGLLKIQNMMLLACSPVCL